MNSLLFMLRILRMRNNLNSLAAGMMCASLRVFRKREDAVVWLLNKGCKFQEAR